MKARTRTGALPPSARSAPPPDPAAAREAEARAAADAELTVEAAMTGGQSLPQSLDLTPQPQRSFELDQPLREARDAFEKAYFEFHLSKEGGSMTRVAEKTGLERTHLYRKLKQLGVDLARGRKSSQAVV